MRTCTLVASVIAHALVIAALVISPALATNVLPEVQRATTFVLVRPELPSPPPSLVRRPPTPVAATAAPVVEPDTLQREPPEPLPLPEPDVVGGADAGVPLGPIAAGGDPLPPPLPPRPNDPVRAGGVVRAPSKIVHVKPVYPPIALAARKEGLVILEAVIAEDGGVRDVRVLRADPLFADAAIAAVQQWRFTPTYLNSEPVPVVMTVTVSFSLTR